MNAMGHHVFPRHHGADRRRVFLIDIENIVGGIVTEAHQAEHVWSELERAVGLATSDQVVIGVCHLSAVAAGVTRMTSRLLVQSGPDGADLQLLRVMTEENLAGRYTDVVLASGDGIFSDAVRDLRADGARVTLVSRPEALATRLKHSADFVHLLPSKMEVDLAA